MVQTSSLIKIIAIVGPTASGKSALSLKCAKALDGEIIGCDSMQIYKGANIGTGKLSESERAGIPHFMIDIIAPNEDFSVSSYVDRADKIIHDIAERDKTPIIVGGTGLYIQSLINGLDYAGAGKNDKIRNKYKQIELNQGKEYLFSILQKIDPESALKINRNDSKRVIRALEIYEQTGITKSQAATQMPIAKYDYKVFVLSPPRETLYRSINRRVDEMIDAGLLNEVRSLYKFKNCQSMQAIGYKELIEYLDGQISFEQAVDLIKINSRHYAKRQLTYFKHCRLKTEFIDDYNNSYDESIIKKAKAFLDN